MDASRPQSQDSTRTVASDDATAVSCAGVAVASKATTTPSKPPKTRKSTGPHRPSVSTNVPVGRRNSQAQRQSRTTLFHSPQPTFEHLNMERSYLLSTLEAQGQKSTDAMRRLSSIQEQLGRNPPSPQRRKIKKQACLLKSKIAEMAEQERVILGRLAELHVELQNRERWARVQREMQSPCFAVESPITPSCWVGSDSTPSDLILTPTMPTPLDATSPEFIPGSRSCALAAYRPWSQPPYLEDGIFLSPDTESAAEFHSFGSPEGLQMWSNKRQLGNDQLRFEYDGNTYHGSCFADDHGPSNPRKHLSTYPSRERRMSLPSLRCIWPGLEEPGAVEGTHEAEKTY